MTLIELSEDQIHEILSCMDFSVSDGMAGDEAILLARYLRDKYNIDQGCYFHLQQTTTEENRLEQQKEKSKEVWAPIYDKDNKIVGYRDTGEKKE